MILTYECLRQFIDIEHIQWSEMIKTLNNIGLEVEREFRICVPQNVVIAKVIKKAQHPNADKLSVCEVDNGSEILQIVCGAKNVRAGQYVALAKVGAILPPKDRMQTLRCNQISKENTGSSDITESKTDDSKGMVIEKTIIRDVESCGMLCSSEELGLPRLNDGILELDSSIGGELILGRELGEYAIFNQVALELSITPNRGDCLCVLGVARDIASMFNLIVKNIVNIEPSIALGVGRFLSIVPCGELHSSLMYRLVEIKDAYTPINVALTLGILDRYDSEPIINFLQYSTYMTGVLFNAYPLESKNVSANAKEAKLVIQQDESGLECVYAEVGSDMHRLNEIGLNLFRFEKRDYPTTFILEASFINAEHISNVIYGRDRSQFNSDVIHKVTRGCNPMLDVGMNFLCKILSGLKIMLYSGTHEIMRDISPVNIHITFDFINNCIGNQMAKDEIARILKRLNFRIQATCDENFFIAQPPIFRNDIKDRQDIVEEILRFYGIDNIESKEHKIPQITQITPAYIRHQKIKNVRLKALGGGFIECVHYVFDNSKILKELGFTPLKEEKALLNPITSELDTLRPSLLPHLLESLQRNKHYGYEAMRLFEIGYVYDENREAKMKLALVMSEYLTPPRFPHAKGVKVDFYSFAECVSRVIGHFECVNIATAFIKNALIHPYQNGKILNGSDILGVISKLHPRVAKRYDLDSVFFCEIDLDLLLKDSQKMAREFSKYQANKRDITILIDKNISFNAIKLEIEKLEIPHIRQFFGVDMFRGGFEVFVSDLDSGISSDCSGSGDFVNYGDFSDGDIHFDSGLCRQNALSIRFIMQSGEGTLSEQDMQESLQKVLEVLGSKFGARLKV